MAAEGDMEAAGSPELLHTDPDTTEDEDDDGDAVMLTRVESLPAATSGHVAAGRTGTDSATSAGTAAAKPAARPSARPSVELIGTQQLGSAFGALMQPLQRRTSVPSAKRPPSPDSAEVQKSATESRLSHLARSGSYQGRVAEQSWVERHKPKSTAQLVTYKKKIEELRQALVDILSDRTKQPRVLLLTGPAGAGKTATLECVADELGCDMIEWITPTNLPSYNFECSGEQYRQPIREQFKDFLQRADRYSRVDGGQADRRIVLVEDLPTYLHREGEAAGFHSLLQMLNTTSRFPVVFIVSDEHMGSISLAASKLFPKNLSGRSFRNIGFNPVAPTALQKCLNAILTEELAKNPAAYNVSAENLEAISASAGGDVRSAINTLQMTALRRSTSDRPLSKGTTGRPAAKRSAAGASKRSKKPLSRETSENADAELAEATNSALVMGLGGRDASMKLFHSLGRVLRAKRDTAAQPVRLPTWLQQHEVHPLSAATTPEDTLQEAHISSERFMLFLHQNYPDFMSSLESLVDAADVFSAADLFTVDWERRQTLPDYMGSVACRGLLHANKDPPPGKWRPLRKPAYFEAMGQIRESQSLHRNAFFRHDTEPLPPALASTVVRNTEIIPYLARCRASTTGFTGDQRLAVAHACHYAANPFRWGGGASFTDAEAFGNEDAGALDSEAADAALASADNAVATSAVDDGDGPSAAGLDSGLPPSPVEERARAPLPAPATAVVDDVEDFDD